MSPRTVAVAPFRNAGGDKYPHIGKALEAMLIDDLSLLQGVRVLDREHVNALIEEARLGGSDLVGEDAAARAGALLVAGGHVDASPTHLSLEAMLVDVDTGAIIASARTEALATEFYNLVPNVADLADANRHSVKYPHSNTHNHIQALIAESAINKPVVESDAQPKPDRIPIATR